MRIQPCTLTQANALVRKIHRHHDPATGHRFSLSIWDGTRLCGVVICGRPVAQATDAYGVLEISRCATDGTKNAISQLYGAVSRAADAMGFHRVQTFTLPEEGGASMKAANFTCLGEAGGGPWEHSDGKPRNQTQPQGVKWKWVRDFPHNAGPKLEMPKEDAEEESSGHQMNLMEIL